MKTDDLIRILVIDKEPQWPMSLTVAVAAIAAALFAATLFFTTIGLRADIVNALQSVRFLLKFVITISLAATAIAAAIRSSRPNQDLRSACLFLLLAPTILVCATVTELMILPAGRWATALIGHNSRVCLTVIPLLSIGPLACFLTALRRGASVNPSLTGAMAGLAASGIAATFYAANCTDDSPLFVATWYPISTLIVTATGYVAGTRLLKW
jgi:hypothetical protein